VNEENATPVGSVNKEPIWIVGENLSEGESEFVDNTQSQVNLDTPLRSHDSVPSKAEIAQQDIDFMKQSWANLADLSTPTNPQFLQAQFLIID